MGTETTLSTFCSLRSKPLNHARSRRLADSNCCLAPERSVSVNGPQSVPGFVYVVEADRGVKIGWTENPRSRFKRLERTIGEEIFVWACIPGTRQDEAAAQRLWTEQRIEGEWFEVTDELLAWAESLGATSC